MDTEFLELVAYYATQYPNAKLVIGLDGDIHFRQVEDAQ